MAETLTAERPQLLLPDAEAAFLRDGLSRAEVIGGDPRIRGGGFMLMAAAQPQRAVGPVSSWGRSRAACFLTVLFRGERPVTVFWDDDADRPAYREVERYARPAAMVGRMARFDLTPTALHPGDLTWVMDVFTRAH